MFLVICDKLAFVVNVRPINQPMPSSAHKPCPPAPWSILPTGSNMSAYVSDPNSYRLHNITYVSTGRPLKRNWLREKL